MKEYISKDYINNLLEGYLDRWCGPESYACSIIQGEIEGVPESEIIYMYVCSYCDGMSHEHYRFCPYCGKPMDEEKLNGTR